MMFHVMVRLWSEIEHFSLWTLLKKVINLHTDGGKTQEIHWSFTALCSAFVSLCFSLQNQLAKHMEKRKQLLSRTYFDTALNASMF